MNGLGTPLSPGLDCRSAAIDLREDGAVTHQRSPTRPQILSDRSAAPKGLALSPWTMRQLNPFVSFR
jgi:hypothetical protein